MNYKTFFQIVVLLVLAALALFVIRRQPQSQPIKVTDFASCELAGGAILETDPPQCMALDGRKFTAPINPEPEVVVDQPVYGAVINNPLIVSGQAKGFWFFEASLPVILKDDQGNVLAQTPATAQADWMTTDYVPFTATLNFNPGSSQYGVLIINKDNPSGDTSKDASFAVPVRFR